MEISSFSSPAPTPPLEGSSASSRSSSAGAASSASASASSSAPPATTAPSSTGVNLGAFDAVQQAMNQLPDSRADVVARGKALAASAIYPAAEIINQLAEMFISDAEASMTAMK